MPRQDNKLGGYHNLGLAIVLKFDQKNYRFSFDLNLFSKNDR